ncbi:MAG: (Fe-S)-binding protein, partial [Gammaproteobacteria bacterium]|nr:(Fe-S)-binding protein [Gammaproteobacteria bacterium]
GALNRHNGDNAEYQSRANNNLQAFSQLKISHIAYFASGCGATLTNYANTLENTDDKLILNRFNRQLTDATDLLIQKAKEQSIQLQALNKKVLIHSSCTTRNSLRNEESAENLLRMIPRIKLTTLKMTNNCCGAGGSQLLSPDDINRQLQQDLIDDIEVHQPDIIVSSNTGCHIQIQNGLKKKGLDIPVVHPVVLFHQQLI